METASAKAVRQACLCGQGAANRIERQTWAGEAAAVGEPLRLQNRPLWNIMATSAIIFSFTRAGLGGHMACLRSPVVSAGENQCRAGASTLKKAHSHSWRVGAGCELRAQEGLLAGVFCFFPRGTFYSLLGSLSHGGQVCWINTPKGSEWKLLHITLCLAVTEARSIARDRAPWPLNKNSVKEFEDQVLKLPQRGSKERNEVREGDLIIQDI